MSKEFWQTLAEAALNHYSRETIIAVMDFVAGLSEDDMKEWTSTMSPDDAARAYRVWRASQKSVGAEAPYYMNPKV